MLSQEGFGPAGLQPAPSFPGGHIPTPFAIHGRKFGKSWSLQMAVGGGRDRAQEGRAGGRPGKPRLIPQSSHSVKRLVYPGDCSLVGHTVYLLGLLSC